MGSRIPIWNLSLFVELLKWSHAISQFVRTGFAGDLVGVLKQSDDATRRRIARQGGLIDTLEPVVDAVAMAANNTREPQALEGLSEVIRQIIDAVPAVISQDLETISPGRPWRVLLLNHCIVATRSHNTDLMETAFAVLTGNLPADALRFFSEGMQQMDALDYPDPVRKVIEKYHR